MTRELLITIRGDRFSAECTDTGAQVTAANTALISHKNVPAAFGVWPENAERESAALQGRLGMALHSVPLFDTERLDPLVAAIAVNYYAHAAGAKSGGPHRLVCRIDFPDYDTIPAALRHEFEASAQFYTGLAGLWINDQRAGYAPWALRLIQVIRGLIRGLGAVLVLAALPAAAVLIRVLNPPLTVRFPYQVWLGLLAVGVVLTGIAVMLALSRLQALLADRLLPRALMHLISGRERVALLLPPRPDASPDRMPDGG